jgi:Domain of unknown function (DUF4918)
LFQGNKPPLRLAFLHLVYMQTTFADQLLQFYKQLQPPAKLPRGVGILYPQQDGEVMKLVEQFLQAFYNDSNSRRLMLGINPGRFGAGLTGINFTAPRQLKDNCGIEHLLGNSSELSAEFIYEMIEQYGGAKTFYSNWFIGAVCPLGFVKDGKNMNYYDDPTLAKAVTPFIVKSIEQQLSFNFNTDYCICIGGEKNFNFLTGLNEKYHWFQQIIPIPHPRFIMQYRRKEKDLYILQYLAALKKEL